MPKIGVKKLALSLKTGQTTQYGGYKDAGYYQKGLAKKYRVLTAGQYAGTTSITLYNRTDLISNNCVKDLKTKLMWSRYPTDGLGLAGDGKLPWTTNANGEGIFPYADAANAAKLAGYDDWRIPNDLELAGLRDMEQPDASPSAVAFPDWPTTDWFWSSTTLPSYVAYALFVDFDYGIVYDISKTVSYFTALVRGG